MSDTVIAARGLGKSYLIGHQTRSSQQASFRDVLVGGATKLLTAARDMAKGRQLVQGDEIEEFWALRDLDFDVRRGDVVGLVGRNGAGKSTLLKVLSRITEPTCGSVEIRGSVASLLEVGTGFHPELTGRENIYLNGSILGMRTAEIRQKFDAIVEFAEVSRFLDTPVKRYSSGMYVRLAFAVAAHLEPEILVVDEVLAVGDAEFQNKCLGKMREVAGNGRTVLFVSHNMGAVRRLCNRAILLESGTVSLDGDVDSVLEKYMAVRNSGHAIAFAPNTSRPSITRIAVDQQALSGNRLVVDIDYASPSSFGTPIGGLVLKSMLGEPVWATNGRLHPANRTVARGANGTLRCTVAGLPVIPGRYTISVWLGEWNVDHDEKLDVLQFDLGRLETNGHALPVSISGYVDWPATWEIAEEAISAAAKAGAVAQVS